MNNIMNKITAWTVILVLSLSFSLLISCGTGKQKNTYYFSAAQIKDHPHLDQVKKIMKQEPDSAFYRLYFGKEIYVQIYYKEDSTEFRFNKDLSLKEVIVNKPSLKYMPESITHFGLTYKEPNLNDPAAYFSWKDRYDGFDVINFYKVGSTKNKEGYVYKIYFKLKS